MPKKPSESITTWIAGLDPADELAVRLAFAEIEPWCRQDPAWMRRIEALRRDLARSTASRSRYTRRSRKIARQVKSARRALRGARDPLEK